ncbi:hypothetical protein HZA75_04755 [Candidatus Roizmanbacteria bacterium]|nr:hypothetical protein [Candidatus Roizmanbacteria bacterium]
MSGTEKRAYQLHLGEKVPEIVYRFNKATVIYPWGSHRGVLRNPVTARKTEMKRYGLMVYESLSRIDLYFSNRYWSLPEGTFFGAFSNKRHEIKIS